MPFRLKTKDGAPASVDPLPLRNDQYPDGIPQLKPQEEERVHAANLLYKKVAELVLETIIRD